MWHYGTGAGGARVTTAWDSGATGAGVVVAVLDTGATHHADLEANLLPGYDFITDAFMSRRATDERVPGGWDLGDWHRADDCGPGSPASDSSWHGTHVSGTIAEVTNNGVGGAGVAYNAKVVPVRVLGRCGGYTSDINDAIVWAAGGTVDGVPANPNPAEVINMSLGGDHACDSRHAGGHQHRGVAGRDRGRRRRQRQRRRHRPLAGQLRQRGHRRRDRLPAASAPAIPTTAPASTCPRRVAPASKACPNGYIWSTHNTGTTHAGRRSLRRHDRHVDGDAACRRRGRADAERGTAAADARSRSKAC